jgi:Ca2+-binding EF-hand superfamily protein
LNKTYRLRQIFDFFQENFRIYQQSLERIFKFIKFEHAVLCENLQSMFMQNFSSLASTQIDLDKFFTFFQENFRREIPNSEKKILERTPQKAFFIKI